MLRILVFTLLLGFLSACQLSSFSECKDQTLAAFDIGSGSTKLLVAQRNSCSQKISKVLSESSRPLGFAQDLSDNSAEMKFSPKMISQAHKAMRELMLEAADYEPEKIVGVATQAFRRSQNAHQLIERWNTQYNVDFRIITQLEEAQLAYLGVTKELGDDPKTSVIVWDIGGGSQQLSWMDSKQIFQTFESSIAAVTYKNELTKTLKRSSPNPLTQEELVVAKDVVQQMLASYEFKNLQQQLKEKVTVVGLGGVHGKSIKNQLKLKEDGWVTQERLEKTIEKRRVLTDQQIGGAFAVTEISNMVLISELMKAYQIQKYRVKEMSLAHSLILNPDF